MRVIDALSENDLCRMISFSKLFAMCTPFYNLWRTSPDVSEADLDTCNLRVTWHASAVDGTLFSIIALVVGRQFCLYLATFSSFFAKFSASHVVVHAEFFLLA